MKKKLNSLLSRRTKTEIDSPNKQQIKPKVKQICFVRKPILKENQKPLHYPILQSKPSHKGKKQLNIRLEEVPLSSTNKNILTDRSLKYRSGNTLLTLKKDKLRKSSIMTHRRLPFEVINLALEKSSPLKIPNNEEFETISEQVTKCKCGSKVLSTLTQLTWLCENIIQNLYSYQQIEGNLHSLNCLTQQLGSSRLVFQGFSLSGTCFFIYGSYSLAVYFLDKALKKLYQIKSMRKDTNVISHQLKIFKILTKVFLQKGNFQLCKSFAFKCLRIAWALRSVDEELQAYDLLGQVYHNLENKELSQHFHEKMCLANRESESIVKLSNFQLQKTQNENRQFPVYESVEFFASNDANFNLMLENHYLMESKGQKEGQKRYFFFQTHQSPNRNLNNFHLLERKYITDRRSKELHFIKPRQTKELKNIVGAFQQLLIQFKEWWVTEGKSSPQPIPLILTSKQLFQRGKSSIQELGSFQSRK